MSKQGEGGGYTGMLFLQLFCKFKIMLVVQKIT